MVSRLVVIGDSFCHGVGTASPFKSEQNTHWSFGRYLAKYYELEYVNLAEPGVSVHRSVELGVRYLESNPNSLVIAGWTHPARLGFYSDTAALQLLPSYALLGDTSDTDVFVEHHNGIRTVTNAKNKQYLGAIGSLHRAAVENDLFEGARDTSRTSVQMFRSWCAVHQIEIWDFNVFPGYNHLTRPALDINFGHIMSDMSVHPTRDQQQRFAELYILKYGKK